MLGTQLPQESGELGQTGQSQPVASAPAILAAGSDQPPVDKSVAAVRRLPDWAYDTSMTNPNIQGYWRQFQR